MLSSAVHSECRDCEIIQLFVRIGLINYQRSFKKDKYKDVSFLFFCANFIFLHVDVHGRLARTFWSQ